MRNRAAAKGKAKTTPKPKAKAKTTAKPKAKAKTTKKPKAKAKTTTKKPKAKAKTTTKKPKAKAAPPNPELKKFNTDEFALFGRSAIPRSPPRSETPEESSEVSRDTNSGDDDGEEMEEASFDDLDDAEAVFDNAAEALLQSWSMGLGDTWLDDEYAKFTGEEEE